MPDPIRPRTKDERMALLAGYSMALEAVEENGTDAAREWLRTMLKSEERLVPELSRVFGFIKCDRHGWVWRGFRRLGCPKYHGSGMIFDP